MSSLPRPEGHHSITPAFVVPSPQHTIAFLERAFGGRVVEKYEGPDGSIMHAEIMLGDSVVMCGEPMPGMEPMPAAFSYYVEGGADDVDATYARAIEAGATSESEPATQFYGYRSATVRCPGGNRWTISARIEDISADEMQRRMDDMMSGS